MKTTRSWFLIAVWCSIAAPVFAQQQVDATVDPSKAAQILRIAIPFPDLNPPPTAPAGAAPADAEILRQSFFSSLTRDLAYSGVFAIAPLPPNIPATPEVAKNAGASFLLRLNSFV